MGTLQPPHVRAQPKLSLQIPDDCGTKDQFVAQLTALKGTAQSAEPTLAIEIRFSASENSYVLMFTDAAGTRELSDPNCDTLFRTAVVMAAASGSDQSPEPISEIPASPAPNTPPSAQGQPKPVPPTAQPPQDAESPPAGEKPAQSKSGGVQPLTIEDSGRPLAAGLELHVGAGVMLGVTPGLHLAGEGGVALGVERWAFSVLGRYLPASTTDAESGVSMRSSVFAGKVAAGYDITSAFRGGLGLSAYRISAHAVGIRHPEADSVWFVAPELEASVEVVRIHDWSVQVALQGRIALNTPRFELEPDDSVVFAVPRLGASGFFRIKWDP